MRKWWLVCFCAILAWGMFTIELTAKDWNKSYLSKYAMSGWQAVAAGISSTSVAKSGKSNTWEVSATPGCTTTQLQKLLDTNKEGGKLTLRIPAGEYNLKKTLYVNPNTTILADSNARMIKTKRYGATLEARLVKDTGGYNGNHDIKIEGGIWEATALMRQEEEGTETFRFIHCKNITIRNATLCNVPEGSHLLVFAGVENATVTNCKFYGYGNNGDKITKAKEAIQLDVVHSKAVVPTKQKVKWDDLPCKKIKITKCEFYDFSRGVGSHTAVAGRFHSNIQIKDNSFHDLDDSAIRLYNYKDTTVSGNTIVSVESGIIVYTYMQSADKQSYFKPLNGKVGKLPSNYKITISNNVIRNAKDREDVWGDGIRIIGKKDRPMKGVKITGNQIMDTSRYGIFATYAPSLNIGGKNIIQRTERNGILVSTGSTHAIIKNNTVNAVKEDGIAVTSGSGYAQVSGNVVSGYGTAGRENNWYGIIIYKSGGKKGSEAKVTGNTVIGSGQKKKRDAIRITESPYTTIYGNRLNKPDGSGISIYLSKNCTVGKGKTTYNIINGAKETGISVGEACDGSKISYNQINQSAGVGINILGGKNITISRNQIMRPVKDGIGASRSSKLLIERNNISFAWGNGISVSDGCSSGKITNNTVISSRKHGITAVRKNTAIAISGNTIHSSNGNGIYVTASVNGKISNNKINYVLSGGIKLASGCKNTTITSNIIRKAKGIAIYLDQSPKSTVSTNTVYGYFKKQGVYVKNSNQTKIKSNTIVGVKKAIAVVIKKSANCQNSKNKIK